MKRIVAWRLLAVFFCVASMLRAETISIDGSRPGRVFDGVGMISGGGGNSRLLIDYPEPYRSQILDYLFKPGYGASLQTFKVEIGADMDSTDGSEASHMHTATDENYHRGYEWWLMEQAVARNRYIRLAALPWGAPGWIKDYWSEPMIGYIIKWLQHARTDHGLVIDNVGGRNEHGYDINWYKQFKEALRGAGMGSIRVVASDDWNNRWAVATDMKKDTAFNAAIDCVTFHTPHEGGYPTGDALSLGKPLWAGEDHFDQNPGCKEMARSLIRNYICGHVTASTYWPIVSAMDDNLPYDNIGLIKCNQPWSGNYTIYPSLWVMAHTAQFTSPGWRYLDGGCAFLGGDASGKLGSYVTLLSPARADYSIILETVDATQPQAVTFAETSLPSRPLHIWGTNLNSDNSADWFVKLGDVTPLNGAFTLTLQPGYVYTITTTTGQGKGAAQPPPPGNFPFPYADNFDSYTAGRLPRFFSEMYGAFEIVPSGGGRSGMALRQMAPSKPICWKDTAGRPFTMIGDLAWTDYRVSCDVLQESPGSVDLIGRLTKMGDQDTPKSYVLRVSDSGKWEIIKADQKNKEMKLASGNIGPLETNTWHHMELVCQGASLTARIDGQTVGAANDQGYGRGMVGLGVKGYRNVQWDNFRIDPVGSGQ